MRLTLSFTTSFLCCAAVLAQNNSKPNSELENPRVFITDSQSWQMSGASGGTSVGFGGVVSGGARPQTAEIVKTFGEECPNVTINNKQDKADYIVLLDHEGGKGLARKDNKVAVFDKDGDSIVSHSTRSLGNAVKDACEAIAKNWPIRSHTATPTSQPESVSANSAGGRIAVSSVPPSADIEIDGRFVGNSPSELEVAQGEHTISVKKAGFKTWERKMKVSSGSNVHLSAELEKAN